MYIYPVFFIYPPVDWFTGLFHFLAFLNSAATDVDGKYPFGILTQVSFECILKNGIHVLCFYFIFVNVSLWIQLWVHKFTSPPLVNKHSSSSEFSVIFIVPCFPDGSLSDLGDLKTQGSFTRTLMAKDVEHFTKYLLVISTHYF